MQWVSFSVIFASLVALPLLVIAARYLGDDLSTGQHIGVLMLAVWV